MRKPTTKQGIFDYVARHLFAQGKPAHRDGTGCAYRGSDGSKCAVGVLISDRAYTARIEGYSVDAYQVTNVLPKAISRHGRLLSALQGAHDSNLMLDDRKAGKPFDRDKLMRDLRGIAFDHSLSSKVLEDV